MKKFTRILAIVLALATIFSFAACSSKDGGEKKMKVGFIFLHDENSTYDKNFITAAEEACKELGVEIVKKTGIGETQACYDAAADLADQGCSIVFADSFGHESFMIQAAEKYPDVQFCHATGTQAHTKGLKNFHNAFASIYEGRYLAGIAAAMQSKTNKVGFIGGQKSDTITRFEAGFTAGAKSVKPDIDVQVQYAESFSDAAKGSTIASTMYASGADVIYQAAGGTGTGVFTAAKEVNEKLSADSDKKVWVIGVDRDQSAEGNYTSSDNKKSNFVLTSTIKQVGAVVKDIANDQVKGKKFEGGKTKTYGIKDGGVDIVTSNLPSDIKDAVVKAKEQIKNGELKPTDGLSK